MSSYHTPRKPIVCPNQRKSVCPETSIHPSYPRRKVCDGLKENIVGTSVKRLTSKDASSDDSKKQSKLASYMSTVTPAVQKYGAITATGLGALVLAGVLLKTGGSFKKSKAVSKMMMNSKKGAKAFKARK